MLRKGLRSTDSVQRIEIVRASMDRKRTKGRSSPLFMKTAHTLEAVRD